ncbi:MAG: polyketide synthase, partial [bacterium]|nr:polyketide synthase [bacterium]
MQTGFEVAVIGMAGRFPGAKNISEFWNNLRDGVESITFFSDRELLDAGVEPRNLKKPDYVKAGGILENADTFDASFFSYIPAEAEVMDPQVRLLHEVTWEALEDAGYDPGTYDGFIGLYAGASSGFNWQALTMLQNALPGTGSSGNVDAFTAYTLKDKDFTCTRISYKLDLKGPSFTMQTACSTSLVAINMACRELISGSCDIAMAGGVTVSLPQKRGYVYREGMILAPDGHCRAFDARAKGTISGCGAGTVVLKMLDQAIEDRDHIYAVVKGAAANNDGLRKAGFTAPSIDGQA